MASVDTISDDENFFLLSDSDTQLQNLFACLTLDSSNEDHQFWQVAKGKLHKQTKETIRFD